MTTTPAGRAVRVLVVEDEPVAAAAHATYVGRIAGFEVAGVAHTAVDAARIVAAGGVDLLLLDMHLPDGHGLGLLQRLRASGHLCDAIAVTSARDAEVVRHAVAHGVVLYLLKPFTFAAFATKLEQYLDYRTRLSATDGAVGQAEVDRLLGDLHSGTPAPLPKGMSTETLQQVTSCLRQSPTALSASEVGAAVGASRVTARRYLEHLAESGALERRPRYGGSGRPELEYRYR